MSVSYTLRLPDNLKRLLDIAAQSGGLSTAQLVVNACWSYLELKPDTAATVSKPVSPAPAPARQAVSMDALRAICAGSVAHVETETAPARMCPYTEYDGQTGETYTCSLPEHSAKVKHVRGPAL